MSTPDCAEPPPIDLTEADLAAVLVPMTDRFQAESRRTPDFLALAQHATVPLLLRAACLQMEPALAALALTLRTELQVAINADLRRELLGTASLMSTLTKRFRQETYVGCVDRAVQKLVGAFTMGAELDRDQWRIASRAVRAANDAISLIALNVLDLLNTSFGFPLGDEPGRGKLTSAERYHLILGLPQAAHQDNPVAENACTDAGLAIFKRLADEL